MKNKEEIFDALLGDSLEPSKREEYLRTINADPVLAQEFESYKDAFKLANILERRSIKERVIKIRKETDTMSQEPTLAKPATANFKKILLLIFLLVLGALAYFLLSKSKTTEPAQIAAEYFSPYPDRVTSLGENELDLSAYNQKNYAQAIIDLNASEDFEAKFYTGLSQLALKEYTEAEFTLESIKNQAPNSYAKAIQWYLALSKLGTGKTTEAKEILEKFVEDPSSNYQRKATKDILSVLK